MDVLHAYALLKAACSELDQAGDHAVAAYIGHGMALLETKYGIDPDALLCRDVSGMASATPHDDGRNWA